MTDEIPMFGGSGKVDLASFLDPVDPVTAAPALPSRPQGHFIRLPSGKELSLTEGEERFVGRFNGIDELDAFDVISHDHVLIKVEFGVFWVSEVGREGRGATNGTRVPNSDGTLVPVEPPGEWFRVIQGDIYLEEIRISLVLR